MLTSTRLALSSLLSQSPSPQKHFRPKDRICNGAGNFAHNVMLSFHSSESSVSTSRGYVFHHIGYFLMSSQNLVRQNLSKLHSAVQNINLESLLRIEVVFFNGHTTAGGLGPGFAPRRCRRAGQQAAAATSKQAPVALKAAKAAAAPGSTP